VCESSRGRVAFDAESANDDERPETRGENKIQKERKEKMNEKMRSKQHEETSEILTAMEGGTPADEKRERTVRPTDSRARKRKGGGFAYQRQIRGR
jgi:hypothetical protein